MAIINTSILASDRSSTTKTVRCIERTDLNVKKRIMCCNQVRFNCKPLQYHGLACTARAIIKHLSGSRAIKEDFTWYLALAKSYDCSSFRPCAIFCNDVSCFYFLQCKFVIAFKSNVIFDCTNFQAFSKVIYLWQEESKTFTWKTFWSW